MDGVAFEERRNGHEEDGIVHFPVQFVLFWQIQLKLFNSCQYIQSGQSKNLYCQWKRRLLKLSFFYAATFSIFLHYQQLKCKFGICSLRI